MPNLLRRAGAALALLALVLCLPQGSLMLCATEGGGVALEAVCGAGSATEDAGASMHDAAEECHCDGGCCGPCQDSPVGTVLSPGRIREDSPVTAHSLAAPVVSPALAGASMPGASAASRRPAPAVSPHPMSRVQAGTCLRI